MKSDDNRPTTPPGAKNQPRLNVRRVKRSDPPRTKSLIMWSGGLDSTYTLVRLLKETDDQVFAHHVHRTARRDDGSNTTVACEYERRAIDRMRPSIEAQYRTFTFSESSVDLSAFTVFARDTATAMYFAAQAAMTYQFTPFDRIMIGVNRDEDSRWIENTESYRFRRMLMCQMLKAVWESEDVPFFYLWTPRPSKQEEADYLPLELFEMTASCRDPIRAEDGFATCGECLECNTLKAVTPPPSASGAITQPVRG